MTALVTSRAPDMPSGCPSAIAPPFGFTCAAASSSPSSRRQASACAANASFSSTDVDLLDAQPRGLQQPADGRHRSDAHDPWRDPRRRARHHARPGAQPEFARRRLVGEQERASAVVDPGSIACRDRARLAKRRGQARQVRERRVGPRVLVVADFGHHAFATLDPHWHDFTGEPARRPCRAGALLGSQRERVLVFATDPPLFGNVLRGLWHRLRAERAPEQRVDEAPTHRRVLDPHAAREGRVRLAHHERRA